MARKQSDGDPKPDGGGQGRRSAPRRPRAGGSAPPRDEPMSRDAREALRRRLQKRFH